MYPIQPTGWRSYFTVSRTTKPRWLTHFFYLSWEDALWDLIKHFRLTTSSVALVPEFFCMDVIQNMKTHGVDCVFYPVGPNLQTNPHLFAERLKAVQPDIVVILHPAGITNTLFDATDTWLPSLPENCLLIEDCVHRVVHPNEIKLISPRHVVIDSLRKVVPLQGSQLFGSEELQKMQQTAGYRTIGYQLTVIYWWLLMQVCLQASTLPQARQLQVWWNRQAERCMQVGYTIIGDSYAAGKGWLLFEWLARHINHTKIRLCKKRQVKLYEKLLKPVWESTGVYTIPFKESDQKLLRGLPIGVRLQYADQLLNAWRNAGLLLRYELDDCIWSQKQKVLYLPLGPHVSDAAIESVVTIFNTVIYETMLR